VDRKKMLDKKKVKVGDVIIGLPSSGIHSNGFSLVRKIVGDAGLDLTSYSQYTDSILGHALLEPTRIYVKPVLKLMEQVEVKSIAHITGGGFYENIPRCLPDGIMAKIDKSSIKTPPVFKLLQEEGAVPERDMFNIFNMGIGMCIIVDKSDSDTALKILNEAGEDAYIIGVTAEGSGVDLC
jgi:phosphoribosylformylglycinamidine cyclo-ligase